MDKVGFIGLGRMGRGMASNLCGKGFELVVYDINPKPMLALEKLGARRANGPIGTNTDVLCRAQILRVQSDCGTLALDAGFEPRCQWSDVRR